jgi:hypothetical protein
LKLRRGAQGKHQGLERAPVVMGRGERPRPLVAPFEVVVFGGALLLGLVVAAATVELPLPAVAAAAALVAGLVLLGPEVVIALALLAAAGLVPFVDTTDALFSDVRAYFFFFWVAVLTMLASWSARVLAGRRSWPIQANTLLIAVLVELGYVGLVMAASDPLAQPKLAAPFVEFPLIAVATYLWLSHVDAIDGVKRALPLVVAIATAWAVAYMGAAVTAGGCGHCTAAVSSHLSGEGLLGPGSRVYTGGQNSLLALVLVAFGQALRRQTPLTLGLATLGLACVAFQGSRAQYFGVIAGMVVLIAWKLRGSTVAGRVFLVAATLAAFVAILNSPVGERALTAYEDVNTRTGTGGYRISLAEEASDNWSLFGAGVTTRTLDLGVSEDLGLSNTFIVVGFVGGALQLAVLLLAFVRGLRARTLAGATIASIFLMVLVTRASLPLMELGHSAITYGAAVGLAAWLAVPSPRHAPAFRPGRPESDVAPA